MATDYMGWGIGIAGIVTATGVAIWAGLRRTPKPDMRIDGVALMYLSLGDGDNTFTVKITNHGSSVGEIVRTEVQATVDGSPVTTKIGGKDVAGTIATGESKELWIDVALPEPMGMNVHNGRKLLRLTVTVHTEKGKAIRASFRFSRDPGYVFVPSPTPCPQPTSLAIKCRQIQTLAVQLWAGAWAGIQSNKEKSLSELIT